MDSRIVLRPLRPGEFAQPREPASEFDDFGPRPGYDVPPPIRVDADGTLAIALIDGGPRRDDRQGPADTAGTDDPEDGVPIGTVGWHWTQWGPNAGSRCPMIGIWLTAPQRGRGYGTLAQRQVVDLLFRHTTANRVEAHTDVENVAEQRALERAGFTREGVTRGAQWRGGAYHDGILYGMVRADWEAGRD